ncbi:MAG TPA: hypothetical protein VII45_09665 [Solirubrobacterales bacterium]
MRKHLTLIFALGALVALSVAGIASAEKPTVVRAGNLILTLNGSISPKALSKTTPTPITLSASAKIATVDGTHPPAVESFVVETDKNGAINTTGLPTCTDGALENSDTKTAEKACPTAIVGKGKTSVQVEFAESTPFNATGPLVVFNGGTKGGVTTLFVHAYVAVPAPTAIVTTVKITKIHNGRYGMKASGSIPKIAGGFGSVTSFELSLNRKYTYKGKKLSYLTAKCPDGHLNAKGTAKFKDGTTVFGSIVRKCTPKG